MIMPLDCQLFHSLSGEGALGSWGCNSCSVEVDRAHAACAPVSVV